MKATLGRIEKVKTMILQLACAAQTTNLLSKSQQIIEAKTDIPQHLKIVLKQS